MPSRSISSLTPSCFHLDLRPQQAASRCSEGAEEVLSFVSNSRREDSLTHVILIFLHKEIGAKMLAHFSGFVWGHTTGVGSGESLWLGFYRDGIEFQNTTVSD